MRKEIRPTALTLLLLSMSSLVTEISLIRVFDVLFYPNISYMIITCSLFAYGLAGFFMGMPFPLGILSMQWQPKGSIAWAWGMNGLFTVIGGLLGIVSSIQRGSNVALLLACVFYAVAFWVFSRIRSALQNG